MFEKFATKVTRLAGSQVGFLIAVAAVIYWNLSAEKITFNDIITQITFLMVFIIQFTQNKDAAVYHLKQNEVIRAIEGARDKVAGSENKTMQEIKNLEKEL